MPRIRCVLYKVAEIGNYLIVIGKSFLFGKMIFQGLRSPFSLPIFAERRRCQWLPEAENQSRLP
nr:MAG TPA: hypothetical protein [Caudoviricetes sp.]